MRRQKWNTQQTQTTFSACVALVNATLAPLIVSSVAAYFFCVMPKEKVKEQAAAQQFFVEMFWDAKTIAEHLQVDEKTVGKWRAKFQWDIRNDLCYSIQYFMGMDE